MRLCAIIPTYNNPETVEEVVTRVREYIADVVVVDDGSAAPARAVVQRLADTGRCHVVFRPENGGKGAAVKTGFAWARDHGFDYALQIDADLQHNTEDIPKLVAAIARPGPRSTPEGSAESIARTGFAGPRSTPEGSAESIANPPAETLVLAQPVFDASAPKGRLRARKITKFFAMVETLSRRVGDPLCGFRVYPVNTALRVNTRGDAMDFDPEIAVRLAWAGVSIVHVPTPVIYRSADAGGVSHYRGFADTMLIAGAHFRLCVEGALRLLSYPIRALIRKLRRG